MGVELGVGRACMWVELGVGRACMGVELGVRCACMGVELDVVRACMGGGVLCQNIVLLKIAPNSSDPILRVTCTTYDNSNSWLSLHERVCSLYLMLTVCYLLTPKCMQV